jgi:inner membrane protein
MDPICHTLVGASLGATGLASKTRYGRATLLIAANLPDVDGIAYFFGTAAYSFRRGVTHGLPAMIVWPVLLALAMKGLGRIGSKPNTEPSFRWLLALAAIGVATHPALDWLNTYGMRWLMPFADTWYYGDTLFIMDWVVWLMLIAGLAASHWLDAQSLRWFLRPAFAALALVVIYIGASFAMTRAAERTTLAYLRDDPPQHLMASPVAFNPLQRAIVLEYEDAYRFATVRFGPRPSFELERDVITKGDPRVLARARQLRDGRRFLSWARFPYSVVEESNGKTIVHLADARYVRDIAVAPGGFGVVTLELGD